MEKYNVFNIGGGLATEGIGVFMFNTFNEIDKTKFNYDFILASKDKQYFEEEVVKLGGRVLKTYELSAGLKGKFLHFLNLYNILKQNKVHVVHSHMDFMNGMNLFVAFLAGIKVRVAHAHFYNLNDISFRLKVYRTLMKWMIKLFATHKIGCSLEAAQYMNQGGVVLFNGVNVAKFRSINKKTNNVVQIVTVGRVDYQKNPFFILDVLNALRYLGLNFHFHWIGHGSLYQPINIKIKELDLQNFITMHGVKGNIHEILPQMDIFLFPSLFEGLPISLLEAQFSGLQCYISENIPEVTNIGLCHQLNLNLGAHEWAHRIKFDIDNNIKLNLDENKAKHFDLSFTTKQLEEIYIKAINNA